MRRRHCQWLLPHAVSLAFLGACGGGDGGSGAPPPTYTVGGSISGLANGSVVVVQDAGTDNTTISTNGSFTFSKQQPNNTSYAVTVLTQPTGQTCTVTAGSGSIDAANVTSPSIACTTNTYTISGVVSGLNSSAQLTLEDNGGNPTTLKANGAFTFSMPIDYGAGFAISVVNQPPAENCIVSNGSQSAVTTNVTAVSITCGPATEAIIHSFAPKPDGIRPVGNLILATDGNFYGLTSSGGQYGFGTVFKLTPQGIETLLYSFAGGAADGGEPLGGLVQGSDGNFYGTTCGGGPARAGVVFKITPSGVETILHTFGGSDGICPSAALVQGKDGNFYGTTSYGAANSNGTVFKISPEGSETLLYAFNGGPADASESVAALIQGTDGNFYGTSEMGGTFGAGTVFKITPSGAETVLYSFTNGSDAGQPVSALVQGKDGNFYGTAMGSLSSGTVFKITPAGAETTLYAFTGGADGGHPQSSLIQGNEGNFYGTTQYGGAGNSGTVYMITAAGAESVLHSFGSVAAGTTANGLQPEAALVQTKDGSFYGTASLGGLMSAGTAFQLTSAGTYTVIYQFDSGPEGEQPAGLIQASDGNFYGTTTFGGNSGYGTVFKMTAAGVETILYAFVGGADGISPTSGVIQGSDGNFYGTTSSGGTGGAGTVYKITSAGTETVVHSFSYVIDGGAPRSTLVEGSDGNFYGTTSGGGAAEFGIAFRMTPSGTVTVLHSFGASADGKDPLGALIQASDGNFYGTTLAGGAYNAGTVFQLTTSGIENVLYSFTGGADGDQPFSALVQGSDGNLYGTTSGGFGNGSVFKITTQGAFTMLHAFVGGMGDGNLPCAALIQGNDGNLYGTTQTGGAFNLGTLFSVTPSGQETLLYSFGGATDGSSAGSIIVGTDGYFYGTTAKGGSADQGTIFRF